MVESTGSAAPQSSSSDTSSISPFPEVDSHLQIRHSLTTKTASIETCFAAPDNPGICESTLLGTGVCFTSELVITSATIIGRVTGGDSDFKAYIGSSLGYVSVSGRKKVMLEPVAVSFEKGVAVLKVVGEGVGTLDFCKAADSPPHKDSILLSIASVGESWNVGNVRAVGDKTIPVKAPWPLKDDMEWIEHDVSMFNSGPPPMITGLSNCSGFATEKSGSPWFNLYGELVGIASWAWWLEEDAESFTVGYAAPLSKILPVVEYAIARINGVDDWPLVMDTWIHTVEVASPSLHL